jgi:hypothetical protein
LKVSQFLDSILRFHLDFDLSNFSHGPLVPCLALAS